MTAEEIKKVIRRAFTRHMVQHVQVARGDVRDRVDLFIDEATDELLTEFASQKDAWIKVSDRLPEKDGDSQIYCLVYMPKFGIAVHPYNEYHKCWDDEDADDYFTDAVGGKITHWKQLPTPPND